MQLAEEGHNVNVHSQVTRFFGHRGRVACGTLAWPGTGLRLGNRSRAASPVRELRLQRTTSRRARIPFSSGLAAQAPLTISEHRCRLVVGSSVISEQSAT